MASSAPLRETLYDAMSRARDLVRLVTAVMARRGHESVSGGARANGGFRSSASRNYFHDFGQPFHRGHSTGSRTPVDDANDELDAVFGVMSRDESNEVSLVGAMNDTPARVHKTDVNANALSHVDASGSATMVDVGNKQSTVRVATASATVRLGKVAFGLVADNTNVKGDVLTVAKIAGINAAKQTHSLIPLCHQLMLRKVAVDFTLDPETSSVHVFATAKTDGKTGVEMEALVAASVAGLTIYDMCKAASKNIVVSDIRLETKTGGKSGDYTRDR